MCNGLHGVNFNFFNGYPADPGNKSNFNVSIKLFPMMLSNMTFENIDIIQG